MKQKTYNSILALIAAVVCSAAIYANDIIVEPYLPPPYPGPPMSEWQWNLYHSVNWAVEQALRQQESSITNLNSIQESITSLDSRIAGIETQVPPQITISRTAETDLGTRVDNTRTDIASLNSLLSQKADISQLHPPVDFRSGDGISLSAWDFGSSPGVAVMTVSLSSNAIDSAVSITNGPLITIESTAATTSSPPSFTIGVDETALAAMFPIVEGGSNGTLLTVTSTEATTNEPMTYTVELDEEALAAMFPVVDGGTNSTLLTVTSTEATTNEPMTYTVALDEDALAAMFPVVEDGSSTLLSVVPSGGAGGTATTYTVDIDESALTGWIVTQTWYESWLTDWNNGFPTYDARYLMLDASNDPLTGTLTAQNIEPSTDWGYNLGSQQARWATTFTKDLVVQHLQPSDGDGEEITIDGDFIPVSQSFSLGSENDPWGALYVNHAHIDGNTLYVGGVPIRSDGTSIIMPNLRVSGDLQDSNGVTLLDKSARYARVAGGIDWAAATIPTNRTWNAVTWAQKLGLFVAVSTDWPITEDKFATSVDGNTWTTHNSPASQDLRDVVWSPELNMFVAVGGAGKVAYSTNGVTWVAGVSDYTFFYQNSVAWSAELGLFVAVGSPNTGISASSTNGVNWVMDGVYGLNGVWSGVAWSAELGLFVAVSAGDNVARVATSTNGKNWTARYQSESSWQDVVWSPESGLFVAVGGAGALMTSPNGTDWTLRTAAAAVDWMSVTWSPDLGMFIAVASNGGVMSSFDGITWFSRTSDPDVSALADVCWAPSLNRFVAVGGSGVARAMTSDLSPQTIRADKFLLADGTISATLGTVEQDIMALNSYYYGDPNIEITPAQYFTFSGGAVTAYDWAAGGYDVVIPYEINGELVTAVNSPFGYNMSSTPAATVVFPRSVTSIGPDTFSNGNAFRDLVIPDSVTSIGDNAFHDASLLTNITFNGNAPTGNPFFVQNTNLKVYVANILATGWGTTFHGLPVVRPDVAATSISGSGASLTGITAAQVGAVATNDFRYLASLTNAAAFATADQGAKADIAVQPAALDGYIATNSVGRFGVVSENQNIIIVSGAGSSDVNGTYTKSGGYYQHSEGMKLIYKSSGVGDDTNYPTYTIREIIGTPTTYYYTNASAISPVGTYYVGADGTEPAPTVEYLKVTNWIGDASKVNLLLGYVATNDTRYLASLTNAAAFAPASWAEPLSTTNDAPAAAAPRFLGDEFFYHNGTNRAIYRAFGTTTNDWVEVWRQ